MESIIGLGGIWYCVIYYRSAIRDPSEMLSYDLLTLTFIEDYSAFRICVSTQQPFPSETKVEILFGAIADLKRYLAKTGRWKGILIHSDICTLPVPVT